MIKKAREKRLEPRFRDRVKEMGGECRKFHSTFDPGWPDRDVLMPGRKFYFAEIKSEGKSLTKLQKVKVRRARALGFPVFLIDSEESLREALRTLEIDQL